MSHVKQLTTFYIGKDLYGIEVSWVQEVTGNLPIVKVPLAPDHVRGLINLRGQIAAAIGLRQLFGLAEKPASSASDLEGTLGQMSVVCKFDGNLVALLVDEIGDVMEVSSDIFEAPPKTVPSLVRRFLGGVYKTESALLSLIDVERVFDEISNVGNQNENLNAS
jgi:purine-binding chemotaxis protein CheW